MMYMWFIFCHTLTADFIVSILLVNVTCICLIYIRRYYNNFRIFLRNWNSLLFELKRAFRSRICATRIIWSYWNLALLVYKTVWNIARANTLSHNEHATLFSFVWEISKNPCIINENFTTSFASSNNKLSSVFTFNKYYEIENIKLIIIVLVYIFIDNSILEYIYIKLAYYKKNWD